MARKSPERHKVTRKGKTFYRGKGTAKTKKKGAGLEYAKKKIGEFMKEPGTKEAFERRIKEEKEFRGVKAHEKAVKEVKAKRPPKKAPSSLRKRKNESMTAYEKRWVVAKKLRKEQEGKKKKRIVLPKKKRETLKEAVKRLGHDYPWGVT